MVLTGQQAHCSCARTFGCDKAEPFLTDQHPAQLAEYRPHLIGVFLHYATRDFGSRSVVINIARILPGLFVVALHHSTSQLKIATARQPTDRRGQLLWRDDYLL
ncbi:MAG TPA: hypothetical protein VE999_22810 [Gemmataceae bacterium]|nr:hypothetical protein [Gemmataceae bacterium]